MSLIALQLEVRTVCSFYNAWGVFLVLKSNKLQQWSGTVQRHARVRIPIIRAERYCDDATCSTLFSVLLHGSRKIKHIVQMQW